MNTDAVVMLYILQIGLIFCMHFCADFMLQSRWMAEGKSKRMIPLLTHIGVYTMCMSVFGFKYALINGALHCVTDFITSRASSAAYRRKDMHAFWCVIGFDQFVHQLCLIFTIRFIG